MGDRDSAEQAADEPPSRTDRGTRQATARLAKPDCLVVNAGDHSDPVFSGYEIHLGETLLGNGTQPLFQLQRLGDAAGHHDGAISVDGRVIQNGRLVKTN